MSQVALWCLCLRRVFDIDEDQDVGAENKGERCRCAQKRPLGRRTRGTEAESHGGSTLQKRSISDSTLSRPWHEFNSYNGRLRSHEAYHNGMAAHICDFSHAALSP